MLACWPACSAAPGRRIQPVPSMPAVPLLIAAAACRRSTACAARQQAAARRTSCSCTTSRTPTAPRGTGAVNCLQGRRVRRVRMWCGALPTRCPSHLTPCRPPPAPTLHRYMAELLIGLPAADGGQPARTAAGGDGARAGGRAAAAAHHPRQLRQGRRILPHEREHAVGSGTRAVRPGGIGGAGRCRRVVTPCSCAAPLTCVPPASPAVPPQRAFEGVVVEKQGFAWVNERPDAKSANDEKWGWIASTPGAPGLLVREL